MLRTSLVVVFCFAIAAAGDDPLRAVLGTWEGESVCVVENPCHNEHVIYDIASRTGANAVTIKADKVVNGKRLFMGTIECTYDPAQHRLSCPLEDRRPADWVFTVSGDTMTGTLTLREGNTRFRDVRVRRSSSKS